MRIQVQEVLETDGERLEIVFTSEFGSAKACWKGPRPEVSETYDVELEIDEPLVWGNNINEVNDHRSLIQPCDRQVLIQGILENQEEDGFLVLRLGDSLVILETIGKPPRNGAWISLKAQRITCFDSNL